MLTGKKILLGVSGSIAAYKSAELVRLFIKKGAEVRVVMTPNACDFITPLTFSTLSRNPVYSEMISEDQTWNNHVELANWADLMIVAPASASTISKMADGQCDTVLMAAYLSAACPVYVAPAMDLEMYRHPSTKKNISKLVKAGNRLIYAASGELASGLSGEGRMEEPENIVAFIEKELLAKAPFHSKKILVTAGPTFEAIDDVRFIGNYSSGKMGFAIAEELAAQGAEVYLVSGPVALKTVRSSIKRTDVHSASEMLNACLEIFPGCDAAVMSAAVADFRPEKKEKGKMNRRKGGLEIKLAPTQDILATLGKSKKKKQVLVGFALETGDGKENAARKLKEKNLDFIVLNSLSDKGAGFGTDTNKITIVEKNNKMTTFKLKDKKEVAKDIVTKISLILSR